MLNDEANSAPIRKIELESYEGVFWEYSRAGPGNLARNCGSGCVLSEEQDRGGALIQHEGIALSGSGGRKNTFEKLKTYRSISHSLEFQSRKLPMLTELLLDFRDDEILSDLCHWHMNQTPIQLGSPAWLWIRSQKMATTRNYRDMLTALSHATRATSELLVESHGARRAQNDSAGRTYLTRQEQ